MLCNNCKHDIQSTDKSCKNCGAPVARSGEEGSFGFFKRIVQAVRPSRNVSSKPDASSDTMKCLKCQRVVVTGLTEFVHTWYLCYGPGEKNDEWRTRKFKAKNVFGEIPIPPRRAEVYGGICNSCGNVYCAVCMKESFLNRLVSATCAAGSESSNDQVKVSTVGVFLDENGLLWCPECKASARTVRAI